MRPTTKPHLLADVHGHLCERRYRRSPAVWEWTRYCVRKDRRGETSFGGVGSELIVGALEWCLDRSIEDVVLEYHPVWIARFIGLGFRVQPLGLPAEIDGDPVIAVQMHFDERALKLSRELCGVHQRVLAERLPGSQVPYLNGRKAGIS